MKNQSIILLMLLCLSCRPETTVIEQFENGNTSLECVLNDGKKDGRCIKYYTNGSIEYIVNYRNDTLHGSSTYYHRNGELSWTVNYVQGKKNGIIPYYDSLGRKIKEVSFKNDKKEGVSRTYKMDGNIESVANYTNDVPNGTQKIYRDNGLLEKQVIFNEKGAIVDFYEYDSVGDIINSYIKLDVQDKQDSIVIKMLNPMYDMMGVLIGTWNEETLALEDTIAALSSNNFRVSYKLDLNVEHGTPIEGIVYDLSSIPNGDFIIKRSKVFKYQVE